MIHFLNSGTDRLYNQPDPDGGTEIDPKSSENTSGDDIDTNDDNS